jgi:hypothetical protein
MSGIAPDFATAIEMAKAGHNVMTKCPAHDDGTASLSVRGGTGDQPVVFHCHAACRPEDILAASGVDWAEVCRPLEETIVSEWTPRGDASHVYSYTDEEGRELFQCLRIPQADGSKSFMQRHADPTTRTGWAWNLQGVRRVLYRLPAILRAVQDGQVIYVVEGEKDAETGRLDGLAFTCNPMGAGVGKWSDEYSEFLRGASVVIVADNDDTGRQHARLVADSLVEHECRVRVVETTIPNCKDYTDHRAHGGTVESLVEVWNSHPEEVPHYGLGIQDFLACEFPPDIEVIPRMIAQANVALLTGFEGHGKSLMCRQVAVMAAAGIHPFTLERIEPRRVLFIDAENPEHQTFSDWRNLAGLAAHTTGSPLDNGMLTILSEWRSEPDLTSNAGQAWLYERIMAYKPELICMGPVQNLSSRDVKDDEVVRKLKHAVNTGRAICGSAFLIEHHSPWKAAGDKERSTRPYGSSLFNKWPDLGYGLKPTEEHDVYELAPNRLPRVRSRAWPERLQHGRPGTTDWPWMVARPSDGGTVYRIGHGA